MHFRFSPAQLNARVRPRRGAAHIEVVDETGSTNADLLARARQPGFADGDAGATAVRIAGQQTAGRGRAGRPWLSSPGASLLMSVACSRRLPVRSLAGLPVAVGGLAASVLQTHGVRALLKWPNDLLVDHAKLGGVLVETVALADQLAVVVGLGINGILEPALKAASGQPVTELAAHVPVDFSPLDFTADLVTALHDLLVDQPMEPAIARLIQHEARPRDAFLNTPVRLMQDGQLIAHGVAHGIGVQGDLILLTPQGPRNFVHGEISLRPL
jgi:BirA family biotin operon repressor/biotin-[acetyl-CoA-carboxylase] ligase